MNDLEQELVDQVIKEHAELTRQRDILAAALREYADLNHWCVSDQSGCRDYWRRDEDKNGWAIAQKALREAGMEDA